MLRSLRSDQYAPVTTLCPSSGHSPTVTAVTSPRPGHLLPQVKSIEAPLGATAVWVAHAFVWAMLAVMVTYKLSPLAAGSGIPEIKSILSGNVLLYRCLNKRTLAAKVLGLFAALSAGLPLGKEGPFIHMACCLSEWLLSLRPFRELKQSYAMRTQMLMAACAVGVGANFGAPVGGVLLAIELTSKYFLLAVYWKCFYTAVVGAMLSRLLYMAYKTKTHVLNATFGSFFDAEEIEADVLQVLRARARARRAAPRRAARRAARLPCGARRSHCRLAADARNRQAKRSETSPHARPSAVRRLAPSARSCPPLF
jgi:hypothetical protein